MNALISSLLENVDIRAGKAFDKFKEYKRTISKQFYTKNFKKCEDELRCAYSLGEKCIHGNKPCDSRIIEILEECEYILNIDRYDC